MNYNVLKSQEHFLCLFTWTMVHSVDKTGKNNITVTTSEFIKIKGAPACLSTELITVGAEHVQKQSQK